MVCGLRIDGRANLPLRAQRMRILLADDEPVLQQLLEIVLKAAKHEVTAVPDGLIALAAFENESFDLVITDLRMPNMDGLTLAREMRERKPSQKILLLTGSSPEEFPTAEIDYVLGKPVDLDQLKTILADLEVSRLPAP